jgi:hypothetical protein
MDFRRAALALTANMSRLQHEPARRGWPTTIRGRQNLRRTPGAAHESVSPRACCTLLDMQPSPLACPRLQPVSRACSATVDDIFLIVKELEQYSLALHQHLARVVDHTPSTGLTFRPRHLPLSLACHLLKQRRNMIRYLAFLTLKLPYVRVPILYVHPKTLCLEKRHVECLTFVFAFVAALHSAL